MSNNTTNNIESLSNNTTKQNNSNDFKESINRSLDESNNQILLYAVDTESGNTNLVTIPL
jgi:hypothetical protein